MSGLDASGAIAAARPGRSLAARLVLAAALWSLVVLAASGWGLSQLYRQSVERQLDRDLAVAIDALIATVQTGPTAVETRLGAEPNDPRFARTFSGRYWQISPAGQGQADPLLRSASLWDEALRWPPADVGADPGAAFGQVRFTNAPGPDGQTLRLAGLALETGAPPQRLLFLAAADRAAVDADVGRFTATLALALAALAAGLIGAVVLQVRVGLAPLKDLEADVARVRHGKAARLDGDYPVEVAPLTGELNKLLDHNREVVERARTHVGNLAHALKTPISVLLNESRAAEGPLAELVGRQADAMARNVDHYLRRAQAAARAETLGARAPVKAPLEDIGRLLERLYGRDRDLELSVEVPDDLDFRGERQDLEEMAGNLMENACKYGRGRVGVAASALGDLRLEIVVDDDGPGLDEAGRAEALKRGARLDETLPGQGLGLSIVAELARLYGGALDLEASPLGGLRARLTLPAAER